MKYRKVYELLRSSGCSVHDRSTWNQPCLSRSASRFTLLYLICESARAKLRLWIAHDGNQYTLTTAQLGLPVTGKAYSGSVRRYRFHTQAQLICALKAILSEKGTE